MLDVRELERQWLQYKIKKYLPFAVLSLSLFVIIVILLNINFQKHEEPNKKKTEETTSTTSAPKQPTATLKKPSVPDTDNNTRLTMSTTSQPESKVLKPSMDFLRKMKENTIVPKSEQGTQQRHLQNPSFLRKNQKSTETADAVSVQNDTALTEDQTETKPKIKIEINKTSKKELQAIIKRFKKNNNPTLGVFIAKKYYEMGDYHKAYNYALITNQIDSTIEESWIIFAKSLVKLGHKERAVKTLRAYIEVSHSSKAKILLQNIVTGKFK